VILSGIGAINQDISASQEIWNFFSQYSCPISATVEESETENNRSVYPNPASDKIQWSKSFAQPTRYVIYSMDGRQVASGLATQEVDVHSLSAGVYILKVAEKTHFIQIAR
jgi:polyhydroxybutyrate depolymerase